MVTENEGQLILDFYFYQIKQKKISLTKPNEISPYGTL